MRMNSTKVVSNRDLSPASITSHTRWALSHLSEVTRLARSSALPSLCVGLEIR